MKQEKNASPYLSIFKGTALFGGVQVFNILINLVRGKLIAIILGAEGMGLYSLLMSSTASLQQISSLGLNFSAVKDISFYKEQNNKERLNVTISVLRKLLYITSSIGSLLTILFSKQLSLLTFDSIDYRWHFVLLSIMIYFTTLSNGELTILQGTRNLKYLGISSIIGSLVGLIIGVPLYYLYGYDGIVPAMIVLSLSTYSINRYFVGKIHIQKMKASWDKTKIVGKPLIILGIIMMVSSLLGNLCTYALNTYINKYGSLYDVGLFQAANSITNQYIGIIFAAMAADFLPRLSGVATDNEKVRLIVNQQSEVVMLIITPLAILLILTAPLLIHLLLSSEFLPLIPVIRLMGFGIFFKAAIFPIGYITFAKGDKKMFFWLEGIYGNLMTLFFNILFYYEWGILGLGISFIVSFAFALFVYVFIMRWRYDFYYVRSFIKTLVPLFIMLCLTLGSSFITDVWISYICMVVFCILSFVISLYELNLRLNFVKLKK